MKLISVTLANDDSKDIIRAALDSVAGIVDHHLVIFTSETSSHGMARAVADVGEDRLWTHAWSWQNDFSLARNTALEIARKYCDDDYPGEVCFALMLDTDERIHQNGENISEFIEEDYLLKEASGQRTGVYLMEDQSHHYAKEKVFLLPAVDVYTGPTHEAFPSHKYNPVKFPKAYFEELPKSPEQLKTKFERDFAILSKHLLEHPKDPRWHYYLGDTLKNLGYPTKAIESYEACANLWGWPEEAAWACYRAAECHLGLNQLEAGIDKCTRGLAHHAGIAELYWMGGFLSYKLGRYDQAVYWSEAAAHYGAYNGSFERIGRIGFRFVPALWEKPYDTLRFAYKELKMLTEASNAEAHYRAAKNLRTGTELGVSSV
jgi:tetratricopeptide (TPR) repeat protein